MEILRIVVMGVAGCGKSTVGAALAARLDARFLDADDLHSPASVAKMAAGEPLTDADREPWLHRVADALAADDRIVIACSALRRRYRDVLRTAGGVTFVFLDVSRPEIERRMANRSGHFMGAQMIDSQFAALDRPTPDENDVAVVAADDDLMTVVARAILAS